MPKNVRAAAGRPPREDAAVREERRITLLCGHKIDTAMRMAARLVAACLVAARQYDGVLTPLFVMFVTVMAIGLGSLAIRSRYLTRLPTSHA